MRTQDFDFELPQELIALRPPELRGESRLLVVWPNGDVEHRTFHELVQLLRSGDVLAINDSRVIPARLKGYRLSRLPGQPAIKTEVTLNKRLSQDMYQAFVRPGRRLRVRDGLVFGTLKAEIQDRDGALADLRFDRAGEALDSAIMAEGSMPLPPYIARRRPPDARDKVDYQTVYARYDGSIAAPTAGLHFTPKILDNMAKAGIGVAPITLHVGAGTFLPVAAEDLGGHRMHAEWAEVSAETASRLNATRVAGGRIVAVGTTAMRTLESAADEDGIIRPIQRETDIFITPGYRFRTADILLTNFHLPRSTLFMLVSAFMGIETMHRAYAAAIAARYRFYSYGDACLLIRPQ